MTSLADVRQLERLGEQRLQRCETHMAATRHALRPVNAELEGLEAQRASLANFLAGECAQACRLSHGQLMTLLRRQAVIRRQLDELAVERTRLDGSREALVLRLRQQRQAHQALLRKQEKYRLLHCRLARQRRSTRLRYEELELEETAEARSRRRNDR